MMNHNSIKIHVRCLVSTILLLVGMGSIAATQGAPKVPKAADPGKSPLGCRDVGYQFEYNILRFLPELDADRNSLYFIFNRLGQPLHLYQTHKDESTRTMYLNHTINAKQWAVLATNERSLKYICTVDDGKLPYGKIVSCTDSVKVCGGR